MPFQWYEFNRDHVYGGYCLDTHTFYYAEGHAKNAKFVAAIAALKEDE